MRSIRYSSQVDTASDPYSLGRPGSININIDNHYMIIRERGARPSCLCHLSAKMVRTPRNHRRPRTASGRVAAGSECRQAGSPLRQPHVGSLPTLHQYPLPRAASSRPPSASAHPGRPVLQIVCFLLSSLQLTTIKASGGTAAWLHAESKVSLLPDLQEQMQALRVQELLGFDSCKILHCSTHGLPLTD